MSRSAPTLTYEITVGDGEPRQARIVRTEQDESGSQYTVELLDAEGQVERTISLDTIRPEPGVLNLMFEGRSVEAGVIPFDDGVEVDIRGISHEIGVLDPRRKALRTAGAGASGAVKTQMPGRIVRVLVSEGDTVEKGQPLLVVEAMKMENELKSPMAGTIRRITVAEGDLVEARAVLVELE